jgi:hypothetical protein
MTYNFAIFNLNLKTIIVMKFIKFLAQGFESTMQHRINIGEKD